MSNAAAIKAKVQGWLAEDFSNVGLSKHGGFTLRFGSSRLYVDVEDLEPEDPEGMAMVRLTAPLVFNLQESAELYKYIAEHTDDYRFGRLYIAKTDDGSFTAGISHQILGNYLDQAELGYAVAWIGTSADDKDDEIQNLFGGERFYEED